jgi:hypothetical protein
MFNGFTIGQWLTVAAGGHVFEGELPERRLTHRWHFVDNRGRRYHAEANDEQSARLSVGVYHRIDGAKLRLDGKPEELG